MKPSKTELRTLLDDVLPSSGEHCGPAPASVLDMVRQERSRRHRVRVIFTTTTVFALAALLFVWRRPGSMESPVASAPEPAPIILNHVNDEQLFALLQGTPAALMKWPNGDRTLLVIADSGR